MTDIKSRKQYYKLYNQINKNKRKKYRDSTKDKRKDYDKIYYQNNKSRINNRDKGRLKEDIQFKLTKRLRSRLYYTLRRKSKTGSAVKNLGCSVLELKLYLESKFTEGMTWDNYGEWHIDHITPLSKFDLTIKEQLLEACHYTNLQPLWACDNLSKGNRNSYL